jgi:hypothetical protein
MWTCRARPSARTHEAWSKRSIVGFQIPAHFTEPAGGLLAAGRGRQTERTMERIGKVAVTGKAQIQRKPGKVGGSRVNAIQRSVETQAPAILVNAQARFATENAGEMKRRTVHQAGDVIEGEVFGEASCQQQACHLRVPPMRFGGPCAATTSRLDAACLISAGEYSIQKIQGGFLNCQLVFFPGEQEATKSLEPKKVPLADQSLRELECLALGAVGGKCADGLEQSFGGKCKRGAIIAAFHRVPDAIGFVPVEEQNLIRVGDEFPASLTPDKDAAAHADDLVSFTAFLAAAFAGMWPTSDVGYGNTLAAIEPGDM